MKRIKIYREKAILNHKLDSSTSNQAAIKVVKEQAAKSIIECIITNCKLKKRKMT